MPVIAGIIFVVVMSSLPILFFLQEFVMVSVTQFTPLERTKSDALTREELLERFDELTEDMGDWKMPFTCVVKSGKFEEYQEACIYFTGSLLQVVSECADEYECYCEGYYLGTSE